MQFAELLVMHRMKAQLSQEELSELAQLSVRALRNLESGRTRYPRRDSINRLAVALNITGSELERFTKAAPRKLNAPHPRADASRPAA